ncbi:methionyl-tRNA formyltransferase [Patescibacteria group bacterium]|nr:methionyl-tRNA formyltransferase [Patescibacteria group bacterium]
MSHRIIYFGAGEFSVKPMQILLDDSRFEIIAVVTQPDKPVGRHQKMESPLIKSLAEKRGIEVFQFEKLKSDEAYQKLSSLTADVFVVVSYGQIIPQRVINIPKMGVINLHGSLLPRWRGASCVQAAIATGDEESGVTIMKIDALMDHGPILHKEVEPIRANDTGGMLFRRLSSIGSEVLPDVLDDYLKGTISPTEQNHDLATYCKILKREDGKIDWSKPAEEIERLIRAYDPWPGTWTEWNGKRMKILSACLSALNTHKPVGMIDIIDNAILIKCGDQKVLEITKLQLEGGKPLESIYFISGYRG